MAAEGVLQEAPAPAPAPAKPWDDFDSLYDANADAVFRTLSRLGVETAQLEDAVQEVFVTAWKKQADFAFRASVKTWLTGIAINVAAHHRRSAARRGKP